MGRRIRYRPTLPVEQIVGVERTRRNPLIILAAVAGVMLVVIILVGYFLIQNRKFQDEFTPLIGVCQNKWVDGASIYSSSPGKHPAVAVRDSSDGWQLDMYFIPGDVLAQSVAETQLVMCLGKAQLIYMERCPYSIQGKPGSVYVIDRYYYKQEVKLIEAKTGRTIAQQTFMGNAPPPCHQTERFGNDSTVKLIGAEIPDSDIRGWASPYLYTK